MQLCYQNINIPSKSYVKSHKKSHIIKQNIPYFIRDEPISPVEKPNIPSTRFYSKYNRTSKPTKYYKLKTKKKNKKSKNKVVPKKQNKKKSPMKFRGKNKVNSKKIKTKKKQRTIKIIVTKRKKHPIIKKLDKMKKNELKNLLVKEGLVSKDTKAPKKVLKDILLTAKTSNIVLMRN